MTQEQFVLGEHFQVEDFIGRAGLAQLLQLGEGHEALGRVADLPGCFQAQGEEGVEVGGGEMDPALAVAFDVDHAEDGQGAVAGDDFGEAAEAVFSSATGSLMMGLVFMGCGCDWCCCWLGG